MQDIRESRSACAHEKYIYISFRVLLRQFAAGILYRWSYIFCRKNVRVLSCKIELNRCRQFYQIDANISVISIDRLDNAAEKGRKIKKLNHLFMNDHHDFRNKQIVVISEILQKRLN